MNRLASITLGLGLSLALAGSALAQASPASSNSTLYGTWRNPKNSVHVQIKSCGDSAAACGTVVWASAKAQEDSRRGSGKELVGLQLFRDLAREKDGSWRGKVFVPDINKTLTGSAQLLDDKRFQAKGCLVAGVFCKSQVWVRIADAT